ncbi:lytic transglycosylase domain-containing protein (plasmid) [Rhizobium sp. 32-5/1]|uniref:lytic transglycosylase domain-containing protein n=1 Tax=Rhizobium sp. 32-5/1 TaxID=3019602 RepID=UPI00240D8727|nr:lytic transglycosylase domain-containing protein [Rhizobium sp. 32-5/1]WEZ86047.1 lytic transglycosylase domain-containing protein [Rhizobium sp. 32-5/1]
MNTRVLAAIPLLAFTPSNVQCFDISRFSGEDLLSIEAKTFPTHQGASSFQRDFTLDSTGALAKPDGGHDMNITRFDIATDSLADADPAVHSQGITTPKKMNTSYSNFVEPRALSTECGPSPMTPAEIENLVGTTAATYGVDPGFAQAIAWTESRFDQVRNSQKGARGPMQLMPDTASDLGVRDTCDPASNIDGGVRHLRALINEFKNPLVAAAAYNAGSRAVYENGGIPPYAETIRYVASVINRQLGLQLQGLRRGALSRNTGPLSQQRASDVIGTRRTQFVNGVMHF